MAHVTPPLSRRRRRRSIISTVRSATCPHLRPLPLLAATLLLLCLSSPASASASASPAAAAAAGLLELRASLGLRARDWPRRGDPCREWRGVSCRSGRVVGLALSGLRRTRRARLRGPPRLPRPRSAASSLASSPSTPPPSPSPAPSPAPPRSPQPSPSSTSAPPPLMAPFPPPSPASSPPSPSSTSAPTPSPAPSPPPSSPSPPSASSTSPTTSSPAPPHHHHHIPQFQRFRPLCQSLLRPRPFKLRFDPCARTPGECQGFYSSRGIKPYDGPVTVTPPSSSNKKSHKNLKYILIAALGGATVLVVSVTAAVLCCTLCVRRNAEQRRSSAVTAVPPSPAGPMGRQQAPVSVTLATVGDVFAYDQLLRATSEFADCNLVKHGHSGDLYRGVLQAGDPVIVKRVKNRAYAAELNLFSRGLHDRLVPFLGHCLGNEDEKYLVYRFVPNSDLANALHRKSKKDKDEAQSLDWIKRLKIAIGVAEALSYLHHECAPPLVHRDIQASSILLDDKFEVRLGSLSDACPQEGSPSATCAYDVYCFGKVLLELVTGKLGISGSTDATTNEWLERAVPYINIYEKDLIAKIVDPTLIIDEDHLEEVWAMAIVAKSCLNPKPSKRPPVRYILRALENPLKVVREDHSSSLRATSSRRSWNAVFWGSWRQSSSDMPSPLKEDRILRRSSTTRSQGSNEEHSFSSHKRGSKDIFPEPSGVRDVED
uniref:Protein kinase domain-containing protein n=1 Tax=Ananas comosus var. bracteatus TaxID=296719 RepID=A0A6V7Q330_ANACO|nr:unnamed protein product [Ananas comosus var. bracteatus]